MRFFKDEDEQTKELHKKYRTIALYVFAVLIAASLFAIILFNFKSRQTLV